MKTIMIVAGCTFSTRNLLRTDVLKTLKSDKNLRIVILSPGAGEDYIVKEFTDSNVIVEELYRFKNKYGYEYGPLEMLFRGFRGTYLMHPEFSKTSNIKFTIFKNKHPFLGALRMVLLKTIFKSMSFRILLEKLEVLIFPDKHYKNLFSKYNPILLLVAFPFYPNIYPVIRRAARNKVKIIAHISSWDNLTSRGELPIKMDRLIVWNDIMKKEAVKYHGYRPEDVWVCGAPQFDICFRGRLPSKEEFFKKIGADLNKKLILYCMGSPETGKADKEILEILNKSIKEGKIAYPCQLLVRQSPKSLYKPPRKQKNIIVMDIGRRVSFYPDGQVDIGLENMIDFACALKYCDVLISTASTTIIDACCFDTPAIGIGFDGYQKKPYLESVIRFYDYTHYSEIVKLGGFRIAKSENELIYLINEYLKNPKLDKEGRKRIVKRECKYTDGRSGRRIAKMILKYLSEL
jgi:spore coat polysaccharide biosynthesis predicted glycosyltransferase SpsG